METITITRESKHIVRQSPKREKKHDITDDPVKFALYLSLDVFDEPRKQTVLSVLETQFNISVLDNKPITQNQIHSALTTLFGNGAEIMMQLFYNHLERIKYRPISRKPNQ